MQEYDIFPSGLLSVRYWPLVKIMGCSREISRTKLEQHPDKRTFLQGGDYFQEKPGYMSFNRSIRTKTL
jgi:hypothetical protein